jgi:hypothetical protein
MNETWQGLGLSSIEREDKDMTWHGMAKFPASANAGERKKNKKIPFWLAWIEIPIA